MPIRHLVALVLVALSAVPAAKPHVRDGMIVFVSDRTGSDAIWGVSAAGGTPHQLTHPDPGAQVGDSHPSFSPDGKQLIFIRENADYSTDLWVAKADGSGARRLVQGVLAASFAPSGTQLAAVVPSGNGNNALALVPAAGGTPRVVCTGQGVIDSVAFAPSGRQIAYADGNRGIVVATIGKTTSCSTAVLGVAGADDPSYGPDGTLVWDQPNPINAGFDIWMKRPGLHAHRIVGNGAADLYPAISPTGSRLLFSSDETGNGTEVFLTDLAGRHIVSLGNPQAACPGGACAGDSDPGWQPLH